MTLILPANLRAPFIAPGRRNRKVHWNAALSKAIRGLGRYEREDWRSGLVFPSGLFGLTRNYLAKKNNPGCVCCDEFTGDCSDVTDCFPGVSGTPSEMEIELPSGFTEHSSPSYCGSCPTIGGTYILTGSNPFNYTEDPFCVGTDAVSWALQITALITCISSNCHVLLLVQWHESGDPFNTFGEQCFVADVSGTYPWTIPYSTFNCLLGGVFRMCDANGDPAFINSVT